MRPASLLPAAVVLAAPLLLAGCSGGAPASSPSSSASASASSSAAPSASSAAPSASAASGTEITGTGYRYAVPDGWGKPGSKVPTGNADSFAADLTDKDGFADNVNVNVVSGTEVTTEQAETQGAQGLKQYGGKEVEVQPRVEVTGEETSHITALGDVNGNEYRIDQYYLAHDGSTYVVTFSFSPDLSQSKRDDTAGSILASWAWT